MITPSFALTATERVLPRMALDFTTGSLDSRITFTRTGNTATVNNSSGYVVPINADLPRFDYNPLTLACNGLLIEESRTNLMTYSSDLADVSWVLTRATISSNSITAPDNTLTADKLVEDTTATNSHQVYKGPFATIGTYTVTVFAKAGERSTLQIQQDSGGNSRFLLTGSGTATALGANTVSITQLANGWYRCSTTFTSTGVFFVYLMLNDGTSIFYTGNGTSGLYLWGVQVEQASFATSYIPTVATQVTRNADVAVMTGTNFSSWYTATTGAAVVWSIPQAATDVRPLAQFDDATALKIIALRGNVADPELYIVDTTVQAQIDAGTIVANTAYKLSGAWNTNDCAAAKGGGTVGTDVVATIPAPSQLRIGSDGTNYACALIQKIMYWKQRIINAEVQAFSK